ncbi:MAG: translation elongation factor Ts [Peptostreptococcaceae bacterium]|nr:translation elongation factor Ts [Peptostreptococcaceae bacterium]
MEITASMVKELREKTQAGMMDVKRALQEADGDMDRAADILREKGLSKAAKKADRIAAEGLVKIAISDDAKTGAIIEVNSETDFVAKNEEFIGFVKNVADAVLAKLPQNVEELKALPFAGTSEDIGTKLNALIAKIGENMNLRRLATEKANGAVVGYTHGTGKIAVLVNFDSEASPADLEELGKDVAMQIAAMNPMYISRDDVDQAYIAHEREILTAQAMNEGKPEEIAKKMVEGRLNKQLKEVCLLDQTFVKDSDLTISQVIDNRAKALGKSIKIASIQRFEVGEGIEKKEEDFAAEVAKQLGN